MASLGNRHPLVDSTTTAVRTVQANGPQRHPQTVGSGQRGATNMAGEGNESSPISTLPAELLIHIFKSFLAIAAPLPQAPCSKVDTAPLLCITRVCRRWRDIAIGYPALWTTVDNNNVAQLDEFARRSRNLGLSMFLSVERQIEDTRAILRDHGQRISRLSLNLPHQSFDTSTLLKGIKTDHLECLTVAVDGFIRAVSNSRDQGQPTPLWYHKLGNSVSSGLSALALRPVVLFLPADHFPNLTHLYLSFESVLRRVSQSMVVKLLKKMPRLETLHFEGPYGAPGPLQGPSGSQESIATLPRLQSCTFVGGELCPCLSLLSHLSLPQDVWIRVSDPEIDPFEPESEPILLPPLLVMDQVTHAEAVLRDYDETFIAEGPTGGIWLEKYIDDPDADGWDGWTSGFLDILPRLVSLNVSISDRANIRRLLCNAPGLVHLGLRFPFYFDTHEDDCELHDPPPFADVFECLGSMSPMVCPALQILALDVVHMHMHESNSPRYGREGEGPRMCTHARVDAAMHSAADENTEDGTRYLDDGGPPKEDPAESMAREISPPLVSALAARVAAGKPVKRLVYQNWASEDHMALVPSFSEHFAKISELLRTATKDYVEEFKVPPPNKLAAPFVLREGWRMEAAEKYWTLKEWKLPRCSPLLF